MSKQLILFGLFALLIGVFHGKATPVKITMNSISQTMTLVAEDGDSQVAIGDPDSRTYTFEVASGSYVLTGIASDGTKNGTILLKVPESSEQQEYSIFTQTIYATNRDDNYDYWSYGADYTAEASVESQEGDPQTVTMGDSSTEGRKTVLCFSGNTVYVTLMPSESRKEEGYVPYYTSATITANKTMRGEIGKGVAYTVIVPAEASVELGRKSNHYTEFYVEEPLSTVVDGSKKTYSYVLGENAKYNVRTWTPGGLTQALYFTKGSEEETWEFTESDYSSYNPKQVNHDPTSNSGYETGDIFVNINTANHLILNQGDIFDAHAMRTWQLTDTQIDNYFFEPDFHFTVVDLDGNPSTGVIEISSDETTSPWRTIKAVGEGNAIVLVTYDAIKVSRPGESEAWMGGEYWGAIWPENTAAFIVSVDSSSDIIVPNMKVNENYNVDEDGNLLGKNAGIYVDAEHDVFYYLDTEDGFRYTFTPEGVSSVTLAYPTIGVNAASYSGFGTEGVTKNEDGSYTLLLKEGRHIVKLTDASGKSLFQVINAKPCHREIINDSRSSNDKFYVGDNVRIQYSGLFHPANKLSGIYNMSAYVTYNGTPNGTSLVLGPGQYTFGSASEAQAVTFAIPEDYDVDGNPTYTLNAGVIQVTGYGDNIGNHRAIDKNAGRSANFTATAHQTYFGAIPDVSFTVTASKKFTFTIDCNAENAIVSISKDDVTLTPDEDGKYCGYGGIYAIQASAPGYRRYEGTYEILEEMDENTTIPVIMISSPNAWDGETLTEPEVIDGVCQISNGAELAWFASKINGYGGYNNDAILVDDIDLGDYAWTPMNGYSGTFDGDNHKIDGLYYNTPYVNYVGLFGYVEGATIQNVSIYGEIIATEVSSVGGIVGKTLGESPSTIRNCANYTNILDGWYGIGGVVGSLAVDGDSVVNCLNAANVAGYNCVGGIIGVITGSDCVVDNLINVGEVTGTLQYGACVGSEVSSVNATLYSLDYGFNDNIDSETQFVSDDQMASGEIAWLLGSAFGQTIGEDAHPILNGASVYKVDYVIIESSDEASTISDDASETLYTNGVLPETLKGETVKWYVDLEMTQQVTSVENDATLYAVHDAKSGIGNIFGEGENINVRWYRLDGVEVAQPSPGTRGIFIRVANDSVQKIIL